ncbi:MAG: hypothetical protein RLZZ618_3225 [Pseudomonadota bacterium]|jgi:DUF971 family protein
MSDMTPPTAIHLAKRTVTLRWDDEELNLSAAVLRQSCRCTDCRRLSAEELAEITPDDLAVTDATPIGNYGLQLHFSDGHERGIYPWSHLRDLRS